MIILDKMQKKGGEKGAFYFVAWVYDVWRE
jgi:hypothetical protein